MKSEQARHERVFLYPNFLRCRAAAARLAHNQEVDSSNLSTATIPQCLAHFGGPFFLESAMKALKSKTINFAVILGSFGAAQANLQAVQDFISPAMYGWLTLAFAVVVAALRSVTKTSLADK